MWEAASIDGCSNTRFFWSIVLPLSKSIIAVMVLYHVVGFWNGFFDALIYLNDESKYPSQLAQHSRSESGELRHDGGRGVLCREDASYGAD